MNRTTANIPRDLSDDICAAFDAMSTADIEGSPEYIAAKEFKETIELKEGVDYGWVWDYAADSYRRTEQIYRELDDKANDIIKYLGGGTGLFTLAALSNVNANNACIILGATPSFVLALIAIALAARARQPNPAYQPPSIQSAFNYAGHYKYDPKAKAVFLGQWHLTCVGMDVANEIKARRIALAR